MNKNLIEFREKYRSLLKDKKYIECMNMSQKFPQDEQLLWNYIGDYIDEMFDIPHYLVVETPEALEATSRALGEKIALWPEVPWDFCDIEEPKSFSINNLYDASQGEIFSLWEHPRNQSRIITECSGRNILCSASLEIKKMKKMVPRKYLTYDLYQGDFIRYLIDLCNDIDWCGVEVSYDPPVWLLLLSKNYRNVFVSMNYYYDKFNTERAFFELVDKEVHMKHFEENTKWI